MPHREPPDLNKPVTRRELLKIIRWRQNGVFACWLVVLAVVCVGILILATVSLFKANDKWASSSSGGNNDDNRFVRFPDIQLPEEPDAGGLISLGLRYDRTRDRTVEGVVCVTYRANSPRASNMTRRDHGTGTCTTPFAEGARWKETQSFVIDSRNNQGLSEASFFGAMWRAMREIDSKLDFSAYGSRNSTAAADGPDLDAPDGKNEIQFGFVNDPDIVAFNVLWGVFTGPVAERELVESDVLYSLKFDWGEADRDTEVMDVEAIGVHELLHGLGFGHVSLEDASMFPTVAAGETKKRTMLKCEIEGLCLHYDEHDMCPGHNSTGTVPPRIGAAGVSAPVSYLLLCGSAMVSLLF